MGPVFHAAAPAARRSANGRLGLEESAHDLKRLFDVRRCRKQPSRRVPHDSAPVDHKRHAIVEYETPPVANAVLSVNLRPTITQHRIVETKASCERSLRLDRVRAYSNHTRSGRREDLVTVTKRACFGSADGRKRLRIEKQDHRPGPELIVKPEVVSILVGKLEIGGLCANLEWRRCELAKDHKFSVRGRTRKSERPLVAYEYPVREAADGP